MKTIDYWRGEAGDAYHARNRTREDVDLEARIDLWTDIIAVTGRPETVAEIGAGTGQNLRAIAGIAPMAELIAVEPNATARDYLIREDLADLYIDGVAGDIPLDPGEAELVFTSGVLIHIAPDELMAACREIHRVAARTIVCVEYFSAAPRMVPYRGDRDRLWTRDFGSFWLDNFPGLTPLGCGFAWKRTTGLDNLTWWAFGKDG